MLAAVYQQMSSPLCQLRSEGTAQNALNVWFRKRVKEGRFTLTENCLLDTMSNVLRCAKLSAGGGTVVEEKGEEKGEEKDTEDGDELETLESTAGLMKQITIHLVSLTFSSHDSLWNTLFTNPGLFRNTLLPTMPDDDAVLVAEAMGYVGWYQCSKGHPYAVGNCTWPMEESKCPVEGCNARIGGQNHVAVTGVKRLGEGAAGIGGMSQRGYVASVTGDFRGYKMTYCNEVTIQVLRLLFHLLLDYSLETGVASKSETAAHLLFPNSFTSSRKRAQHFLRTRINMDWKALKGSTGLTSDKDLATAVHLVIANIRKNPNIGDISRMMDFNGRIAFTQNVQNLAVNPVLSKPDSREVVQARRVSLSNNSNALLLREHLGSYAGTIFETDPPPQGHAS